MDFEKYMTEALALAREAADDGEVPVGCVIVGPDGSIIGRGRNRRRKTLSVLSHAEMDAMAEACSALGDWRLDECTAFVTLEPCPMCAGAMINARLGTLVYGAREPEFGSAASIINLFEERYPSRTAIYGGVMAQESEDLLRRFFREVRTGKSAE